MLHIHGSAFGHRNFEKLTPIVSQYCQVIDFDLPGYGESRSPVPKASFEALADMVFEFAQHFGAAPINVHGTSFGAMIALALAARHPEAVDRLVLSCFLARYDRAARLMRRTWKRAAMDSGMAAVADLTAVAGFSRSFYEREDAQAQLESMYEAFERNLPQAFVASTEVIERTDLSGLVGKVRAPMLLLAGSEDNMTPFRPASSGFGFSDIRKQRPETSMHVLEDCGHYLVLEQPEQASALIRDFLA